MDEIERIAAPFQRLSDLAQRRDKARELMRWATPTCGGCYWWMKSRDCPREQNVQGMTRGPSSGASPCPKFQSTTDHLAAVARYQVFLAEPF